MYEDLENSIRNSDLRRRLQTIRDRVESEYLRFWQVHAPHYTDHGRNHCITIAITLKEILEQEITSFLHEYELFILLSSIWLHDIGIMVKKEETETDIEVRKNHNQRSKEMVRSHFNSLLNPQERIIISDICWAHSKNADINELSEYKTIRHPEIGNQEIRQKFLASLLRFSDALDICCTRTSETILKTSHILDESRFYHALHDRVSGLIRKNTQILIDINYSEPEEIQILSKYIITPLNFELDSVRNILIDNGVIITAVLPRYNLVDGLDPLPEPPIDELESIIDKTQKEILEMRVQFITNINNGEIEEAQKLIEILVEKNDNNALIWSDYGMFYIECIYDEEKALKGFKKANEIEPDNTLFLSNIGHIYGEFLLDIDNSFIYFEKTYLLEPENHLNILNYAEALITKERYPEAKKLSQKVLKNNKDLRFILLAKFFMLCSQCLIDNSLENKITESELLFRLIQETSVEVKPWVLKKLKYFISEVECNEKVKLFIISIINYFEEELPIEELFDIIKKIIY